MSTPERSAREGFDLTVRAVALSRAGAHPAAVLAAVDQAETSLRGDREPIVARPLLRVCQAITGGSRPTRTDPRTIDHDLQLSALALGIVEDSSPDPRSGPVTTTPPSWDDQS